MWFEWSYWSQILFQYCERQSTSWFAEPLNLLSNAAFFVAAGLSAWRVRQLRMQLSDRQIVVGWIFVAQIATIGLGSALFHSLATRWAQVADVLPIGVFALTFLVAFLRHRLNYSGLATALHLAILAGVTLTASLIPSQWMNGSNAYLGIWIYLFVLSYLSKERMLYLAGRLFTLSLICRTIDQLACPHWQTGTHFAWHLLNGTLVYLCCHTYLKPQKSG